MVIYEDSDERKKNYDESTLWNVIRREVTLNNNKKTFFGLNINWNQENFQWDIIEGRNDSEDECTVTLDWDKSAIENLQEILYHITRKDGVSKGQRLGYLNCFTKFCIKINNINADTCGLTTDEIFCCLRVALFHEACDVRAAGLRAIRYLLRNEQSLESLYRVNLPLLISRSIDIVLDNRSERIQALRLIRHILSLDTKRFPSSITNCLVAISKDGFHEKDILTRACVATLTELTLMNPVNCAESGGISAIIDSVLFGGHPHNICESLLGVILYLLNSHETRRLFNNDLDIQHFVAPFTDLHGFGGEYCDSKEMRESRYNASKNALLTILRSWTGLIYMCRISYTATIPCGIESLISMLHLPYSEIQRYIMEIIFEVFYIKIPEWTDDIDAALISTDPSTMQDSWWLYDGFVAAEGKAILPHIAKNRLNLMSNYLAMVLFALINYGILEALVSVIINSNDYCCSTMATVLTGELLHLSSRLLPSDCAHRCHSLPSLMLASTSDSPQKRNLANAAISTLNRIHLLKKRGPIPCSLYLDQLLQFCQSTLLPQHNNFDNAMSKTKLRHCLRRENDDHTVIQAIKDSQVIGREFQCWDWDLIDCILKWPGDALRKIDDTNHHKAFVKRLLVFYKPSSKMFSKVNRTDDNARIMCIIGQHFLDFLILEADETKAFEHIEDYFSDLDSCFAQIAVENPPQNAILSPIRLLNTLSHAYFLFIGRLSSSNKGKKLLEKASIYQYLLDLISLSSHDIYMKLIVSSLDYTKELSFSRTLLTKVLTCTSDVSRLYATNYLRVLMRAGVSDFRKWAIELLLQQLYDKSNAVSLTAADILDEACDSVENLEIIISLRPSLLHTGDNGLLLLIRFLSVPNGFKYLRDSNYLGYELKRWQSSLCLKYVKIVENVLNESFTYHQRSDDGTYGRRTDKKNTLPKNAFIPPHIYGQLVQTSEGYNLLINENCLAMHYQHIRSPDLNTNLGIIQLKAALWAVGHFGSSILGFQSVVDADVIPRISILASECPYLSIRGTCYFVMGLLSTTIEGSDTLKMFGWESIRHDHHEKFPLIKANRDETIAYGTCFDESRRYTWSMSSTTTKLGDYSDTISGKDVENDSFVMINFTEEPNYSGSLPTLASEFETITVKKISLPNPRVYPEKSLSRVASLSPNHCSSFDSRPRSSSDCLTGKKMNGHTNVDGDGIWFRDSLIDIDSKHERHDSGLIDDAPSLVAITGNTAKTVLSKSSALHVKYPNQTPKRKISEPIAYNYYNTLIRDERSDSNESSHNSSGKSRSGSFADSTSGISASSGDSSSIINTRIRGNNLSPIASVSSISNLTQSTIKSPINTMTSSLSSTLPRRNSRSVLIDPYYESPALDSIPTAADAHGLTLFRNLQNNRVPSLGSSLPAYGWTELQLSGIYKNGVFSYSNETESDSAIIARQSSDSDSEDAPKKINERKYMGLALPINIDKIFTICNTDVRATELSGRKTSCHTPYHDPTSWKTHLDRLTVTQLMHNNGLELHKESNCLLCFKNSAVKTEISLSITEFDSANDESLSHIENISVPVSPRISKHLMVDSDVLSSSFASSGSFETATAPQISSNDISNVPNYVLNRREILRFVTNLCGSVHAKQAEQGLLNLKQKCPSAFEDICLYSEISLQLSTYNFRLSARRFLQELFLDVNFDSIYTEADLILRRFSGHVMAASASMSSPNSIVVDNGENRL